MRLVLVAMFMACGPSGREAPSCSESVGHYYAAGCTFTDLNTGVPFTVGEWTVKCRDLLATAPPQCEAELADWRICMDSVPTPSTTNADCDCSAEQEALLTCE